MFKEQGVVSKPRSKLARLVRPKVRARIRILGQRWRKRCLCVNVASRAELREAQCKNWVDVAVTLSRPVRPVGLQVSAVNRSLEYESFLNQDTTPAAYSILRLPVVVSRHSVRHGTGNFPLPGDFRGKGQYNDSTHKRK